MDVPGKAWPLMVIRLLRSEDGSAWLPLWSHYLAFYGTELAPEITQLTWTRICAPHEPIKGLGAFENGALIGFAHYLFHPSSWADTSYCYLEDLFVSQPARGKGVGGLLLQAVQEKAQAAQARRIYWVTAQENIAARKLYDKFAKESGFVQYRMPQASVA